MRVRERKSEIAQMKDRKQYLTDDGKRQKKEKEQNDLLIFFYNTPKSNKRFQTFVNFYSHIYLLFFEFFALNFFPFLLVVLYERTGDQIAHVKFTVLLQSGGTTKVTGLPLPSGFEVRHKKEEIGRSE